MSHEHWVPTDILVEFMLKLPVKSLLRCKSVCKRWYSLISSKLFINYHLNLAPCNAHCRLISIDEFSLSCGIYTLDTFGESFNVLELDNPFTGKDARARIFGSCNGLLCINFYGYFFIWNPSTRRVNNLPYCNFYHWLGGGLVGFGFGYDESNDDYKVVAISSRKVNIYSLKSGYWKTLGDFPRGFLKRAIGTLYNGALHWIGYRDYKSYNNYLNIILSFDLATETLGEILQPVYDNEHTYKTLCTFGEWLSVVCNLFRDSRLDVWVMKVYGVQDSWTKLVSIPHLTITDELPLRSMALNITQDGKILLKLKKELVLYDPKNSSFSEIQKIDTYNRAFTFVESLVSPMPVGFPDTHGFFNSILLRFKNMCAPGHILSCLPMPNLN